PTLFPYTTLFRSPFAAKGRENEIPRSFVFGLRLPFQQRIFQRQMHRQHLGRRFRFCRFQMSASAPVVRVLNAEAHAVEVAVRPAQGTEFASTCAQRSIQNTSNWSRNPNFVRPSFTCSDDKTRGAS